MQLNMQQLLPRIQTIERLLLDAWRVCGDKPEKPKQALTEFTYMVFVNSPPPLYRFPEKAEIIIMEQFLLNSYPFSSDFPFNREEMRKAIEIEGGTY